MPKVAMKKLAVLTIFLSSFGALAECPQQRDLDIQTEVKVGGVQAGGNHGYMDVVTISAPSSVEGIPFQNIQLTYGEVSEYWLPLATKNTGSRVLATLSGYSESIKVFEFWVNYSDGTCALYQAGSIAGAYNNHGQ
ncbi:hypothetical protein [Microbulbifer pacificus]|uniref:Lipoprotein n=1 Tax=Microbulbifer pacificus TaxID=407164 RepID=A0AAU0MYZ6_9GAMM|nr:hypothetical protein [Microbulbifer pacificus]WOX05054.1 hypothetical protein R5R33_15095 [Microbulbifer pacificus]